MQRKKGLKRNPVSPIKRAKKRADIAFSLYIRARDNKCMIAGLDDISCGGVLQCMHIVTRGVYILRFDETNALAGCQGHHVYYTNHPREWEKLIEENFPDRYQYTEENRREQAHFKLSDYEEYEKFYKRKYEELL